MGYEVAEWIEEWCVVPDGDKMGQPFVMTDEQLRFVLQHYRLDPDSGEFAYRRSLLVRPQKWGKGPLTGALVCAEAVGPVRFAGWDSDGQPVGKPWPTPWIQVAAASEDQTANVWRSLLPMIREGPLANVLDDTGLTRINLPGGGYVEPVTAEGRSRLGQRITFAIHDEPHSWLKENGGHLLADTQRRNLAGMKGRSVATTNAWNPAEMSDAQRTAEAGLADVFVDYPPPPPGSAKNKRERKKVLRAVYGDSAMEKGGWVDLSRIDAEIEELASVGDLPQAERFYLNRVIAVSDAFFDYEAWDAAEDPRDIPPDSIVTLGFDGSMVDDWTAIRGRVLGEDGSLYGFTPTFADGAKTIWNPADYGGEVPRDEVNTAIEELFDRYTVVRLYADPELWQSEIEAWAAKHSDKRVISWPTYRTRPMSLALERLRTDVATSSLAHDGCHITKTHLRNARRRRRSGGVVVGKASNSQKIDSIVADTLAHEAASDARAAGLDKRRKTRMIVMR